MSFRFVKIYTKTAGFFLWNSLIRFLIEGYIEICIVGFLNMKQVISTIPIYIINYSWSIRLNMTT
jgi:hypothetical protein